MYENESLEFGARDLKVKIIVNGVQTWPHAHICKVPFYNFAASL